MKAVCILILAVLPSPRLLAQVSKPRAAIATQSETSQDSLGRGTPRGAVLGFLNAAHKGDDKLATLYLNTRLRGDAALNLSRQLCIVLDRRLPAKLQRLSDQREGSMDDPLNPKRDLVGTIRSGSGDVDIFVERVDRGKLGTVWLFSNETLNSIPDLYKEVGTISVAGLFPDWLVRNRLVGIPLYEWIALLTVIPLIYVAALLISRLLSFVAGAVARRVLRKPSMPDPEVLPRPSRLLVVALTIFSMKYEVGLTLMARQLCTGIATLMIIVSCVWLVILWNGKLEAYLRRRLESRNNFGGASVLRLARRAVDVLAVFIGVLAGLKYFRLNITAALAGLGVGGIAVALAAQKTLENVIGGISIIVDRVVKVGDFIKVGDTVGTVEDIGLRSIRIRTNERTIVSIPNGQIAGVSLENFCRDKVWLHHFLSLRYDTTPSQLSSVVEGVERLLLRHPLVEPSSARVRFLRFGTSSLDVELFAYILTRDYAHFLQIQNELLLAVMEIVQSAGTEIALQTPVLAMTAGVGSDKNGALMAASVNRAGH
jgi:MscS family membrane protein